MCHRTKSGEDNASTMEYSPPQGVNKDSPKARKINNISHIALHSMEKFPKISGLTIEFTVFCEILIATKDF